ncbi:NADH-quinone oxidoreductase subunit H [Candidatus Woesearchaeota archaeon]|nr:NADH-quinone oxidoreductase subunit H [Candidatus Woesearchaeota archaeon]
MKSFLFFALLNLVIAVALAPFYMSLIKKVKAWAQRREGPSIWQSYYNLLKLFKKEVVYSSNSSWVMKASPYVNIVCLLAATLFVPLIFIPEAIGGFGNIILFLYLLALAKFFMALAGLDAGSTFGGMGSSREMTVSSIIEPVAVIVFAALAFVFHSSNFFEIFGAVSGSSLFLVKPSLLLLGISLFIVLITETARVPVDNPETHLELTMIHEAMILEQSGRNLALMEMSSAIKQLLLMGILINLFFPIGLSAALSATGIMLALVFFVLKSTLLAIFIGLFESYFAKLRLFRLPSLFLIAFFLSLLTILLEVLA